MKRAAVPLAAALVALLPSCGPTLTRVDFATHPSVLRGTWTGEAQPNFAGVSAALPVRLEVQATYLSESNYAIGGALTVGADLAHPVQGEGSGGGYMRYIRPQLSVPPPGFRLTAKGEDGLDSWELYGSFASDIFYVRMRDLTAPADNRREYILYIRRTP